MLWRGVWRRSSCPRGARTSRGCTRGSASSGSRPPASWDETASEPPRRGRGALSERPVVAGVLGALVIAFSAILVDLADVSPAAAAVWRCAYALPVLGVMASWEQRRYG